MLDAYVIEEIKRREREKGRDERPSIELPLPSPDRRPGPDDHSPHDGDDGDGDRGVVIIDYSG